MTHIIHFFYKKRKAPAPHPPVVITLEHDILMRMPGTSQTTVETLAAGRENIFVAHIDIIPLRGVMRQLQKVPLDALCRAGC